MKQQTQTETQSMARENAISVAKKFLSGSLAILLVGVMAFSILFILMLLI